MVKKSLDLVTEEEGGQYVVAESHAVPESGLEEDEDEDA